MNETLNVHDEERHNFHHEVRSGLGRKFKGVLGVVRPHQVKHLLEPKGLVPDDHPLGNYLFVGERELEGLADISGSTEGNIKLR